MPSHVQGLSAPAFPRTIRAFLKKIADGLDQITDILFPHLFNYASCHQARTHYCDHFRTCQGRLNTNFVLLPSVRRTVLFRLAAFQLADVSIVVFRWSCFYDHFEKPGWEIFYNPPKPFQVELIKGKFKADPGFFFL